jgi:hypothetical protein
MFSQVQVTDHFYALAVEEAPNTKMLGDFVGSDHLCGLAVRGPSFDSRS